MAKVAEREDSGAGLVNKDGRDNFSSMPPRDPRLGEIGTGTGEEDPFVRPATWPGAIPDVDRVRRQSSLDSTMEEFNRLTVMGMDETRAHPHETCCWAAIAIVSGIVQFFIPVWGAASWAWLAVLSPSLTTDDPRCWKLAQAGTGIVLTSTLGPTSHLIFAFALYKLPTFKPIWDSCCSCTCCSEIKLDRLAKLRRSPWLWLSVIVVLFVVVLLKREKVQQIGEGVAICLRL